MKLRTAIATATTAAILATSGVAIAGAASNTSPPSKTTTVTAAPNTPAATPAVRRAVKARRVRIRALIRRGAVKVVTVTIGIDRATLRKDLLAGQTIAAIATANNVSPQTVINALIAAATTKLNAAVTAKKITSARATKIEGKLPARVAKFVDTWLPKKATKAAA